MKRDNVFENDSPTLEMETQTLRQTQQGHTPFVNGIPMNPYSGATLNPANGQFQPQPGFTPFNGIQQPITPNQFAPQFVQGAVQPQPYQFANNFQPVPTLNYAPGYYPNAYPTPYAYAPTPFQQMPWAPVAQQYPGTPFPQPFQPQYSGLPTQQLNYANTPVQNSQYQPAINIADGQVTLLPNQYTPTTSKNGSTYKNGERDFISWFPNVNILETDRSFKLEICVPGVTRENCRINVDKNNILRINGTRRWNQETEAVGFTRKDFNYGSFACSFVLTENLQHEKITSSCRNGILIVSIPKRETNTESEDRNFSEISVN